MNCIQPVIIREHNSPKPRRIRTSVVFNTFWEEFDITADYLPLTADLFIYAGDLDMLLYLKKKVGDSPVSVSMMNTAVNKEHIHIVYYLEQYGFPVNVYVLRMDNRKPFLARYNRYVSLMNKTRDRAARIIQQWWVPIVYDLKRTSGMRLFWRNYEDSCRISGWDMPTDKEKRETEENWRRSVGLSIAL